MERIIHHLLKLIGTKDSTITNKLQGASSKFTHDDAQNELLGVMASFSKKVEAIRKRHFDSILCDKRTNYSNIKSYHLTLERLIKI